MGDVPVDAQRIVDELRASRRATGVAPRGWNPSEVFADAAVEPSRTPVHLNEDLAFMHRNYHLGGQLAPPPARGVKGIVKKVLHRLVMAVLAPYFERLQEYLAANTRAVDSVSKRVDEVSAHEAHLSRAVKHDLVDLARYVDERTGG